jgi:outer membrane protein
MAQTAPPSKVAVILFQQAVLSTKEGQAAQASLKAKFDPRKAELEKRQTELQAIQEKLQKGGATLAADVRTKMERDLASGGRSLNNDAEDLNSEVQAEENRIMQGMATRMGNIIKDYANKNGYSMVIDVSSQQSAVLWASPSVNITADIVKLYDQAHGAGGPSSASAAKPPASANPSPAAAKQPAPAPAKPPAAKKQ